jgi:hypothetical protein
MRLATTPEGGFRIDPDTGAAPLVAEPAGEGWEIPRDPEGPGFRLLRDLGYPGGFVLLGGDGAELGRVTRETGEEGPPSVLLAPDGCLFRIRRRGADVSRFELLGWEVPGAYLTARPEEGGFEIARTEAGRELDLHPEVLILFAAEILDAVAADGRG